MLQSIRDKTSGWIAYFIIGLISVPFALWGINSYLGGGEQTPAAIVDGEEITSSQLDNAYGRYRERLMSVFGGTLPAAFGDENTLKEQVLGQVIEERVLLSYIKDSGFRVGDEQLFSSIKGMQLFHQDGQFNKDLYQNQLASQGYNPAFFEMELRRSQEMEQLNKAIKSTSFTVPAQVDLYNQLQNQQRKIRTLTVVNNVDAITISDQDVEEYYNKNSNQFMDPQKVKVDYVELSLSNIKRNIDVKEDQVRERYEQMRDQLTTAEFREASHILLTVNDTDDEDAVKQKISDIKSRIDAGEDFAALATELSQDPGSAPDGGSLGEVEKGMMVKPFEAELFSMTVDQVSDPVKTQFGWHLIKLHAVSGGETQTFEQAAAKIENDIKSELAESQIYDLAENLANIGYEQSDSLLPASEQLGLKIQTTEYFTRNQGTGLAEDIKVRQAAFSDEVLNQKINSATLELDNNRIVLLHLNSLQPATQQSVEAVKQGIIDTLKVKKGRELATTQGKEILADLKSGSKTLDDKASTASIAVVDAGFIKRTDTVLDQAVLSAAFTLPKPELGKMVYAGVTEVDGDYTVIEFSDVKSEVIDSKPDDLKKQFVETDATYEYQAVLKTLTSKADVIRTPVAELQ